MKKVISFFCCLVFSFATMAQPKPVPEAEAFFKSAISSINTRHLKWIEATANDANQFQWGPATILSKTNMYAMPGNLNNMDIEALAMLLMMQAAKSAQEDLKAIMAGVKAINEQKAKQREMLARLQKQQAITGSMVDSFRFLQNRTALIQQRKTPDLLRVESAGNNSRPMTKTDIKNSIDQLKNDLESMNEMGEMESLRLQMAMDRMNKMYSTISNLFKKIDSTKSQIIQNLK